MRGNLGPGTLIAVVHALFGGQKSGVLEIVRGAEIRKLLFQKGIIKFATTNVPDERLGDFLLKNSRLTAADLEKASKHVGRGERLGQILVRMGLLSAEDLTRFARDHILHIILNSFAVKDGEYRFEEVEIPLGQEIKAGLSVAGIIMEAVRRFEPVEALRLMDESLVLRPSTNETLRSQPISLGPQDGFLMSRVDGSLSVGDIISVSPLPAAETSRTLLGLWCAGLLEDPNDPLRLPFGDAAAVTAQATASAGAPPAQPAGPAKAATAPPPAAPQQSRSEPVAPPPASSSPSPTPQASAAPASGSTATAGPTRQTPVKRPRPGLRRKIVRRKPPAAATTARRVQTDKDKDEARSREVLERFENSKTQNFYEMLGVWTSAEEPDIRRAYYAFAKRLHPDRFQAPQFERVRKQAEHLFATLTEAYNILSNTETRKEYDEHRAVPQETSAAERKQEQSDMARQNFMAGKAMLQKGKFHDAVKFFENALELDDRKAEYYQYLGSVQLKNPKWRRDAERNFAKALEIDPSLVTCYVNLGNIYVRTQQLDKAEKMFRAALQWDPDQPVAKRELERLEGKTSGAGLLKGIFKK